MKIKLNLKDYLPEVLLFSALFAVVFFRWQFLDLHFFWDEAWVYGPAIKHIINNGWGIFPETLPESISRGHPILFHAIYSIIPYALNNESNFIIHLSGLIINLTLVVGFYISLKKLTTPWVGLIGALTLLVNGVFYAQINLILPEILLGISIFCAITFLSLNNLIWFSVFTAISLLVKESAVILPFSVLAYFLFDTLIGKDKNYQQLIRIIVSLLSASLPVSIFFIIQFIQRGYIFFPEHLGMIKLTYKYFRDNFELIYSFVFEEQGRYIASYLLFLIICFFSNINWKKGLLVFAIAFTMVKIIFRAWSISALPNLIILSILFGGFYYIAIYQQNRKSNNPRAIFLNVTFLFTICYFLFSSINFFTLRYTLPIIIVFTGFFSVWIFDQFRFKNYSFVPSLAFLISVLIYTLSPSNSKLGDTEVFYSDALYVQKDLYEYLVKNNLTNSSFYGNFTNEVALNNAQAGLVSDFAEVKNIGRFVLNQREYIIHSNYDEALNLDTLPFGFDTVKSFINERARIDLLKTKPPQP